MSSTRSCPLLPLPDIPPSATEEEVGDKYDEVKDIPAAAATLYEGREVNVCITS